MRRPAAVARHYLVIGPWDHGGTQMPSKDIDGLAIPENAVLDMKKLHADWYDWALGRAALPAFFHDHRVAFYVMGENAWRYANTLEASSGQQLVLHLRDVHGTPAGAVPGWPAAGASPGSRASGAAAERPARATGARGCQYAADENLLSTFRAYQKRALVFHSEPFATDVTFAGHMRLLLDCRCGCPGLRPIAQVMLIRADGSAVRLGEDIRRARFRNSPSRPSS